jgi:hypothetical protein
MTLRQRLRRARARYIRSGSDAALVSYLRLKARSGRWDKRYLRYYGVDGNVTSAVKRFIMRAYAAGLVPTSTRGGRHAPGSYHYSGRAADIGLRRGEVGTARGLRKMVVFQRSEYKREGKYNHQELIGPDNARNVLRGSRTPVSEGTSLEQAHDNHVHGAF